MAQKWSRYGSHMPLLGLVRTSSLATPRHSFTSSAKDTFMSKTARLYQDTRAANASGSSNLDKLNDELQDVTRIMTKNMEELLWRGDSLDSRAFVCLPCISSIDTLTPLAEMSHLSTSLRSESEKYRRAARNVNIQAMLRQYAPFGAVAILFIVLLWWRFS